jgi:hypothetical protein
MVRRGCSEAFVKIPFLPDRLLDEVAEADFAREFQGTKMGHDRDYAGYCLTFSKRIKLRFAAYQSMLAA